MSFLCFACGSDENTTVNGTKIKFFEFPSDEKLQKHWESICTILPNKKEKSITRYLCELHFDQSSFSFSPNESTTADATPMNYQNTTLVDSVKSDLNVSNKLLTESSTIKPTLNVQSTRNFTYSILKKQNSKPYRLKIQIDKVYVRPCPKSKKINQDNNNCNSEDSVKKTNLIDVQSSNVYQKVDQNCHQCLICYKTYAFLTELHDHVKKHFICDICGSEFMSLQLYSNHYKLHKSKIKEFPYKCHTCQIIFESKEAIRKHNHIMLYKDEKEENRFHYCKTCNMTFRNAPTYRKHLNSHMQKAAVLSFNEHKEKHTIVSPIGHLRPVIFNCRVCSKNFTSLAEIDKHTKTHMGQL